MRSLRRNRGQRAKRFRTHAVQVKCPVFCSHSFDDTNCQYAESVQFQALLKSAGKDVTLSEPPAFGDHYLPMIDEGIPRGRLCG